MKKLDNQLTIQLNIKNNLGQNIVGILERKSLNDTFGAKLGIICHGFSEEMERVMDDVEDIDTVVRYLESEFGYKLYAAIGHSKGSNSILLYACYVNRNIPHIINLSPRYYLPAILSKMENSKVDLLMKQGYAYWEDKSGVGIKITLEELYFDNSFVSNMPETTTVLTCHGIADE
ncbi:11466_t:CDS:2, partial [Funneliformis mosseae]